MIDLQEIETEINRLELEDTSYQNCTKLAVLYSIIDHNRGKKRSTYSSSYSESQSEFVNVCLNAPQDEMLKILDEHFEAIKILYPKEYSIVIKKLKDI